MTDDLDFTDFKPPPAPRARDFAYAQARVASVSPEKARKWFESNSESDRAELREMFKKTPEYERTKEFCEWSWKRGKDPMLLCMWAHQQAQKLGVA